jgi:hypothetical protein
MPVGESLQEEEDWKTKTKTKTTTTTAMKNGVAERGT